MQLLSITNFIQKRKKQRKIKLMMLLLLDKLAILSVIQLSIYLERIGLMN